MNEQLSLLILSLILQIDLYICFRIRDDSCSWNKCSGWSRENDVLNVHLICHTHDDPGWIKTVDQYYYGSKNSLTATGVQYIVNTVMDELEKDPTRRFAWCETSFLWRWLIDYGQTERLKKFVRRGQIEFIGGGWVQNDEAAAHYVDIVEQMTLGLRTLKNYFGDCGVPRVAWQIDPFGHSREMANLLALMDFDAVFFSRLHFLEKEARVQNSSLEFIWSASDDLKTNILTSAFYGDSYGPPPGFCFDAECLDEPIMNNVYLEEYNADQRVNEFTEYIRKQASHQRTNHVMLLMGGDFQYTNANRWYTNLDKLIQLVRKNNTFGAKINIFYSTPTCYLLALTEAHPRLPKKLDDFFPYASGNHSYWTGFYTSRPAFKGFIRQSSSLLQFVKKLQSVASLVTNHSLLQNAVALAQHHDAVTGTARENVTKDYELRLSRGWNEAESIVNSVATKMLPKLSGMVPEKQVFCRLINETVCNSTRLNANETLIVYNPNSHPLSTILRIPFYSRTATLWSCEGKALNIQINKAFYNGAQLKKPYSAPYELLIPIYTSALGFSTFFLSNQTESKVVEHAKSLSLEQITKKTHPTISSTMMKNEFIELTFDAAGRLVSLKNRKTGRVIEMRQEFLVYQGMGYVDYKHQSSGAYIFRPNGTQAQRLTNTTTVQYIEGSLINETRQIITPWISQVIRLYRGKNFVEFEWTIGPIPKEPKNPVTKEIITRYTTNIKSAGLFYTDSNGRQMMKRRNHYPSFLYTDTEPVAGNYYPVNSRIYIRDSQNQLTVLTDRSQGGTSLNDGQIELMLHRRSFYDDNFGVGEPLDEPGDCGQGLVVRGRHWIVVESTKDSAKFHRPLAFELYNTPVLTFAERKMAPSDYGRAFVTEYSALNRSLPLGINVMTMEMIAPKRIIIRLEHIFQGDDDKNLAQPLTVDLNDLFNAFDIISMEELNLATMKKRVYKKPKRNGPFRTSQRLSRTFRDLVVDLLPMEIRTFEAEINPKTSVHL